jgi:signal transduction histidine kinase
VLLDEKLIRHILVNLVSNSIKYSPSGGLVQLNVNCQADQTLISVSDQGMGIPKADQAHIFEPFFRADNVGAIKGTGLGLAITKRAIELHHGTIRFESKPDLGTTFFITIPILEYQEEPEPVEKL